MGGGGARGVQEPCVRLGPSHETSPVVTLGESFSHFFFSGLGSERNLLVLL